MAARILSDQTEDGRTRVQCRFENETLWLSQALMYLRVHEILALAADYAPAVPDTLLGFKIVQNRLHFAATGKTAPELISERADADQPDMGLTA